MNTIEQEFNSALQKISPNLSVKMGPYAGRYTIYQGVDEDGDPIEIDGQDFVEEHFPEIINLTTEDNLGGFRNVTYRISPRLVVTIDDNDNHFELSDKTDAQIIADQKTVK